MKNQNAVVEASGHIQNLTNLDMAKFICAILVVVIHTGPLKHISNIGHFYLSDVVARIAVPLFFAISGYLLFRQMEWQNGKVKWCPENIKRILHYEKKIGALYLGWACFYIVFSLPFWYQTGWWGIYVIKDAVIAFFARGSYYHLWYLLAVLYAVPLLFLLCVKWNKKTVSIIAGILWLMECLLYSYTWIGYKIPSVMAFVLNHFPIIPDAVFRALPLLFAGICCITLKKTKGYWLLLVISGILSVIEASCLYFFSSNNGRYSYLLVTPLFSYAVLLTLLILPQVRISGRTAIFLREASLLVYCVHPALIKLYEHLSFPDSSMMFLLVLIISLSASWIWWYGLKKSGKVA